MEFVRLSHPERIYGEKKLLESQISLLTISKIMKEFDANRKEEIMLKISLKKTLSELKEALTDLEHLLPKSTFYEEKLKEEKAKHEIVKLIIKPEEKQKSSPTTKSKSVQTEKIKSESEKPQHPVLPQQHKPSLEEEIEKIKKRIASLR